MCSRASNVLSNTFEYAMMLLQTCYLVQISNLLRNFQRDFFSMKILYMVVCFFIKGKNFHLINILNVNVSLFVTPNLLSRLLRNFVRIFLQVLEKIYILVIKKYNPLAIIQIYKYNMYEFMRAKSRLRL